MRTVRSWRSLDVDALATELRSPDIVQQLPDDVRLLLHNAAITRRQTRERNAAHTERLRSGSTTNVQLQSEEERDSWNESIDFC